MKHNKDLVEIAKFLDGLNADFERLRDNQEMIIRAYNGLAELWQDKVYSITGQVLIETADTTRKAYSAFSEAAVKLQKKHEILCEYQEISEARHYGELEFPTNFILENTMNNGKMLVSASDIESFERALSNYLEALDGQVKSVGLEYEAVGASWMDEQYTRLGEDIAAFTKKTAAQSEALSQLALLLGKKRQLLEEAEDKA
jgi:hypothetical protein